MDIIDIRAEISVNQNLKALIPDTQAIADQLAATRKRVVPRLGGIGVVLEVLGPEVGATVLDALDALKSTSSPVKWVWVLITRGDLDFGSAATRGMIQALGAQQVFGPDSATIASALLSIAEVPDVVDELDVRRAIYADDGSLLV